MPNPVSSTSPVFGGPGSPGTVERADSSGSWGGDTFLRLLMAQMTHQDPLAPTDSAQMLTQLAQFANVEGVNKLNTQVTALNLGQDFAAAVSMIGKSVTWLDDEGATRTGIVQGVKPSPTGAVLVIDGEDVPSGFVQRVE